MLKRVDERYGNPSNFTDIIMNDIKRFQHIADGDYKKFTEFVNFIEKSYRDFGHIKMEKKKNQTPTL